MIFLQATRVHCEILLQTNTFDPIALVGLFRIYCITSLIIHAMRIKLAYFICKKNLLDTFIIFV